MCGPSCHCPAQTCRVRAPNSTRGPQVPSWPVSAEETDRRSCPGPLESRALSAEGPGPDLCSGRNREESGGEVHLTHKPGWPGLRPSRGPRESRNSGLIPLRDGPQSLDPFFPRTTLEFFPSGKTSPTSHIHPSEFPLLPRTPAWVVHPSPPVPLFPASLCSSLQGQRGSPQTSELFSGTVEGKKRRESFQGWKG